MKKLVAVGIVSDGCEECHRLKEQMVSDFLEEGVELTFQEVVYEFDPDAASKLAMEYGLDDLPSFYLNGVVFKKGYWKRHVRNICKGLLR
jgi:hypothetical protein